MSIVKNNNIFSCFIIGKNKTAGINLKFLIQFLSNKIREKLHLPTRQGFKNYIYYLINNLKIFLIKEVIKLDTNNPFGSSDPNYSSSNYSSDQNQPSSPSQNPSDQNQPFSPYPQPNQNQYQQNPNVPKPEEDNQQMPAEPQINQNFTGNTNQPTSESPTMNSVNTDANSI